jgi:hypothetical protein
LRNSFSNQTGRLDTPNQVETLDLSARALDQIIDRAHQDEPARAVVIRQAMSMA